MMNRWYYSLLMLGVYVTTFVTWKVAPSRTAFVMVGGLAIGTLLFGMLRAAQAGYFANRVDLLLHGWVIFDLFLETAAFEAFKLVQPFAVMQEFHNNMNFIGCTLTLSVLLGGYRWYALQKSNASEMEILPSSNSIELAEPQQASS